MLQKVFTVTSLSVLYNYFDGPKLFSGLYFAKFLDTLVKSSFSCIIVINVLRAIFSVLIEYVIF